MENKKSDSVKPFIILICVLLAALYLIGIADLPYGYYQFIRLVSLVGLLFFIFLYAIERENFLNIPNVIAGLILILFNPILPIYLDKETWVILDIICAVALLILAAVAAVQSKNSKE